MFVCVIKVWIEQTILKVICTMIQFDPHFKIKTKNEFEEWKVIF